MQKSLCLTLIFIILLLFSSCIDQTNPCLLSKDVLGDIHTLDSLVNVPELREQYKHWMRTNYSEPSLLDAKVETYRFIWRSTFDTTKIVRVENVDGHFKVTRKLFISHQDTIGRLSKFEIKGTEWDQIVNGLTADNFWTYPTSDNRTGLDGSNWLLEGYKSEKDKCTSKNYHRVRRWSPNDTTFIAMCDLLYNIRQ